MRIISLGVLLLCLSGCAGNAPPSLTPAGVRIWQANEAVVAIGSVQHVAIALNGVQRCEAPPNDSVCAPVLSDANTRVVVNTVTAALKTIEAVPSGWKATATEALTQIGARLDAAGQSRLSAYLAAARAALAAL